MTKAEVVAHSKNMQGDELISFVLTFPHIILPQVLTHRMASRNTSSSRAVPFDKMLQTVKETPFVPIAFQKHHKGMQGTEYLVDELDIKRAKEDWLNARAAAVQNASYLYSGAGVTKQLANRLLEPFMWTTMLFTMNVHELNHFFDLRCPKYKTKYGIFHSKESVKELYEAVKDKNNELDYLFPDGEINSSIFEWYSINESTADIHIQELAEAMYDALGKSEPKKLKAGEWHIPFDEHIDVDKINNIVRKYNEEPPTLLEQKIKLSVAMTARVSYTTIDDDKDNDYVKLIAIHDKVIANNHSSCLEHTARAMDWDEYYSFVKGDVTKMNKDQSIYGHVRNIKGFIPYRYFIENKTKKTW